MATATQITKFISEIAPLIAAEARARGYKFPSAVIAQACLESGYGTCALSKYHNYFGLKCGGAWKGKSVNMQTMEEYEVGTLTSINDNFRVYDNMVEGVKGYFDFINYSRYANLRSAESSRDYLEKIKADGYATSSKYVVNVYKVVEKYNLTQFDTENTSGTCSVTKEDTSNTKEVLKHPKLIVNAKNGLNMRVGAGIDKPVMTIIPFKAEVEDLGDRKTFNNRYEWVKVHYKNFTGWCYGEYLDKWE